MTSGTVSAHRFYRVFNSQPVQYLAIHLLDPLPKGVTCFVPSRLFGNSGSADLWSPCLPSRQNQAVPAVDEGTHLRSGLHCGCHYFWCLRHDSEAQAMKTDHSHTPAINSESDQIQLGIGLSWMMYNVSNIVHIPMLRPTLIYCCLLTVVKYFTGKYNPLLTATSNQAGFHFYYAIIALRQSAEKYKWCVPCPSGGLHFKCSHVLSP